MCCNMMSTRQCLLFFLVIAVCTTNVDFQGHGEDVPVVFPAMEEIPENGCTAFDGSHGRCRPAGLCVFRFESEGNLDESACSLNDGKAGVCCPGKPPPTRGSGSSRPEEEAEKAFFMPEISSTDLDFAGQEGRSIVQRIDRLETELRRKELFVKEGSPEYFHQTVFGEDKEKVWKLGKDGLTGVEATLKLVRTFKLSSVQSSEGLRRFSLANTVIRDTCWKPPSCPSTKYRTHDGTCNNLQHPEWGRAFHTYARILPSRYADGINEPRASNDGGPLPSSREVSNRISPSADRPSGRLTVAFVQWAQFLAYDLSLTAVTSAGGGELISCCQEEITKNSRLLHPACLPIHISDVDPFHRRFENKCMNFIRSIAAPRNDCSFGAREQLNQVTAYIDGSTIYGASENRTKSLRSFVGGKMKRSSVGGGEMLPTKAGTPCHSHMKHALCFEAGDPRCNEHILLSLEHGLWLRQHNRLADELGLRNPGWTDEIIFRETRRIVAAQLQHITYSEFLPLLLGTKVMSSFKLSPKLAGYSFDYDPEINADIINSFATAAGRFGHTLVQEEAELYSKEGRQLEGSLLNDHYFDPSVFYEDGNFDALTRGMVRQRAQTFDNYVSSHLTDRLFEMHVLGQGLDLVALTIQRGRDHGLPGYNEFREHCGLPRVRNFEDLASVLDPAVARNFSRLYRSVDDVDLYPAAISEKPLPDAIIGPTLACIVAEQFRRLKHGDRFWYENGGLQSSFSQAQLSEIRKVTLARILCDNADLGTLQVVAFVRPANWNPTVECSTGKIPKMNLDHWKNEPVWA